MREERSRVGGGGRMLARKMGGRNGDREGRNREEERDNSKEGKQEQNWYTVIMGERDNKKDL